MQDLTLFLCRNEKPGSGLALKHFAYPLLASRRKSDDFKLETDRDRSRYKAQKGQGGDRKKDGA